MPTQTIDYQADGLAMKGHLAHDGNTGTRRPGVLVFPEVFGLGKHAKSRTERLAGLGYVALAADLHGEQYVAPNVNEAFGLLGNLRSEPTRIRARTVGALDALRAQPGVDPDRIAAIGFCFGGTMALELGRSGADVKAVIGFHSGLQTKAPEDAKNIRGKVLVCIGANDPTIDGAQRTAFEEEMRAGNANWQMNVFGGVVHSFTNPDADKLGRPEFASYNRQADERSWADMLVVFAEVFG